MISEANWTKSSMRSQSRVHQVLAAKTDHMEGERSKTQKGDELEGRVLVGATPSRSRSRCQAASTASEAGHLGVGVDLRDVFGDDMTSEIGCFEEEGGISTPTALRVRSHDWSSTTPQQKASLGHERVITMIDRDEETEESEARAQVIRNGDNSRLGGPSGGLLVGRARAADFG